MEKKNLANIVKTLSDEDIVRLLNRVYVAGKADGYVEDQVMNGYEHPSPHDRPGFSALQEELEEDIHGFIAGTFPPDDKVYTIDWELIGHFENLGDVEDDETE